MSDPLPDDIDWSVTTFEGNRRALLRMTNYPGGGYGPTRSF